MAEESYFIFFTLFNVIHQLKSQHDTTPLSMWNTWRLQWKSWALSNYEQMPGNIAMYNTRIWWL